MGAVLIGHNVKNLTPGIHGSTFGGNPLACAAGIASLALFEKNNLLAEVRRSVDDDPAAGVGGNGDSLSINYAGSLESPSFAQPLAALDKRGVIGRVFILAGLTPIRSARMYSPLP